MAKKRKRRLNREALRQTVAPTHDFEFPNPHDEDELIVVTCQRLSPGHLLEMNSSSLLKAYQQAPELSETEIQIAQHQETDTETDTDSTSEILKNFDRIVTNTRYAAEIASLSIIDEDTREQLYTKEDCMRYLPPELNSDIANWALAGARPETGEAADDVDRFPTGTHEQAIAELETDTD